MSLIDSTIGQIDRGTATNDNSAVPDTIGKPVQVRTMGPDGYLPPELVTGLSTTGPAKKDYTRWIIGGVLLAAIVGGAIWWMRKNKML